MGNNNLLDEQRNSNKGPVKSKLIYKVGNKLFIGFQCRISNILTIDSRDRSESLFSALPVLAEGRSKRVRQSGRPFSPFLGPCFSK